MPPRTSSRCGRGRRSCTGTSATRTSAAAAFAEAQWYAERVDRPDAPAAPALSKAQLARWGGHPEEARRQLGAATALLGDEGEQSSIRTVTHDLLGYLADDLGEARAYHATACAAASEAGHVPLIARALVGVADLALRRDEPGQAARLPGGVVWITPGPRRLARHLAALSPHPSTPSTRVMLRLAMHRTRRRGLIRGDPNDTP
ncbi:hypothetical protein [Streptomyces sp. SD15]